MRRPHAPKSFTFLPFLRTLAGITGVNLLLLGAIWLAQRLTSETLWPLAFLLYMPQHLLLLPPLALMLIGGYKQRTGICLANGVVFIVVLFFFLGLNVAGLHSPHTGTASGQTLRVMSYNIRYGSGGMEEVTGVIKTEKPDIVCLQEVLAKESWPDPLPVLKKHFPQYSVARYGSLVTLSRFPILQSRRIALPRRNGAGFLETQISVSGKTLGVYNAHFINPIDGKVLEWPQQIQTRAVIRQSQLAVLTKLVQQQTTPYLIAGDFNTPARGRLHHGLMQLGTDAYPAVAIGFGYTFPAAFPLVRIDRILCGRDLKTLRSRVISTRASDHRPLMAELAVQ